MMATAICGSLTETLAYRLRVRRLQLGKKQYEIAERAGIARQTYGKIERGELVRLESWHMPALAHALETSTDYLHGISEDAESKSDE